VHADHGSSVVLQRKLASSPSPGVPDDAQVHAQASRRLQVKVASTSLPVVTDKIARDTINSGSLLLLRLLF